MLPLGGAVAQRLRGYKWRSEKSVKAIAPTGAALAFLCFDFFFRIVKGEQPLATGCGTQHPLRALGGTRVLLAAAPTTAPCFRRWRRSQLLHCGAGGVQRWGGGNRNTPPCLWPSGASLRAESKQKLFPRSAHFSAFLLPPKENIPGLPPPAPPLCAKGCFLSNQHAIIDERCYFLYTKLISTGTIFLLCQWLLKRI